MKKITYTMRLLSSLIVSPRAGMALYKGIDEFCAVPDLEIVDPANTKAREVRVIYPFYQYGEYKEYDPKHASYYIPGSSIKGALQPKKAAAYYFMVDDVRVPNDSVSLRNLYKAQYLEDEDAAGFANFFDNVGIEMVKGGTDLQGELYLEENALFSDVLESANQDTKEKMNQMITYLQMLLTRNYKNGNLKDILDKVQRGLTCWLKEDDIILVGGYKGLLHSILLDRHMKELSGGLFIDYKTMLPHGLVKISSVKACNRNIV
ncbi:hypothetical protein LI031_30000 [Enterocloster citroniae]|uniref:hypothetical protein n=1 Tax=Enterocloster citroniae TaxID=358743 RepID=UPI001D097683|nr:hypothetical protein [Enterocloster citroniae]MCB7068082.1 hypothetical protein [Enterocloster citroniae]